MSTMNGLVFQSADTLVRTEDVRNQHTEDHFRNSGVPLSDDSSGVEKPPGRPENIRDPPENLVKADSKKTHVANPGDVAVEIQKHNCMRQRLGSSMKSLKGVGFIIRAHPLIVILPLICLGLMVGLGTWGVLAAAKSESDSRKNDARAMGVDVAASFELQLKETFTPAITLSTMIEQIPSWQFWEPRFSDIAASLMEQVVPGSLYNIQFQPFGQVRIIEPMRPNDATQIGRDLVADPQRRVRSLGVIGSHEQGISVLYLTPQNFTAAFVRQPVYLLANGSFPEGYNTCEICYNASVGDRPSVQWWGFITLTLIFQAVAIVEMEDSHFSRLAGEGYNYAFRRPLNATHMTSIVEFSSINYANAVFVNVTVPSQVWVLWLDADWEPNWTGPLVATVVILALVISLLAFVALLFYHKQGALLEVTMIAYDDLEKTTAELAAEKVRLDALLVRQYGLLACLDMKALTKNSAQVEAQTGLTLDRIEEAHVPRSHLGYAVTKEKKRPLFPVFCHKKYADLACRCWDDDFSVRPTFEDIVSEHQALIANLPLDTIPLVILPPKAPGGTAKVQTFSLSTTWSNSTFVVGGPGSTSARELDPVPESKEDLIEDQAAREDK
eukprot:gene20738-27557_t